MRSWPLFPPMELTPYSRSAPPPGWSCTTATCGPTSLRSTRPDRHLVETKSGTPVPSPHRTPLSSVTRSGPTPAGEQSKAQSPTRRHPARIRPQSPPAAAYRTHRGPPAACQLRGTRQVRSCRSAELALPELMTPTISARRATQRQPKNSTEYWGQSRHSKPRLGSPMLASRRKAGWRT